MTVTLKELNERTGFANKRDFVTNIYDYVEEHQELTTKQLESIRDAYLIQGDLANEHTEIYDGYYRRCQNLGMKKEEFLSFPPEGQNVVDDHILFPTINTLEKFNSYVFTSAINNKPIEELLTPIYQQAIDYAKTVNLSSTLNDLQSYTDDKTEEMKNEYSHLFNIIDPTKLELSQEIKDLFPGYEVSENDPQKLVNRTNNSIVIFTTKGFERNEDVILNPKDGDEQDAEFLQEVITTPNSIAYAESMDHEPYPSIEYQDKVPKNLIQKVIDAERAYIYDYAYNAAALENENLDNDLANGLSDLSTLTETQL